MKKKMKKKGEKKLKSEKMKKNYRLQVLFGSRIVFH